jgi:hypothetical protein
VGNFDINLEDYFRLFFIMARVDDLDKEQRLLRLFFIMAYMDNLDINLGVYSKLFS